MNQDIHSHLEKLKTELNKLEPAVMHLQKADENATALIASLANIHKEYTKHLQNIEKSLSDANDKYQKQLTKEIQDSTKKVTDAAEQLSKSNTTFEKQIKTFLMDYEELAQAATKLIEKIDGVDFPTRLDKLDVSVSAINQGLQNTQTKLENLGRDLKDDLLAKKNEMMIELGSSRKQIKLNTILIVIAIGFVIGTLAMIFINKF